MEKKLAEILGEKIKSSSALGGGCIAESAVIETQSKKKYFLKSGVQGDLLLKEAHGLQEIEKSETLKTPKIIALEKDFLLLEYIESSSPSSDFWENFGSLFAKMHRYHGKSFGFYEDNYIGASPQNNIPALEYSKSTNNWCEFYFNKRLLFQFRLAEKNGYADTEFRSAFKKLALKLPDILSGSEEPPSLLHGDLWSGNYLPDLQDKPYVIDPAVYYGHREADLAMTKLFGGFSSAFYKAYHEEFPLLEAYEERENIYKLYHVMNHLNLFGRSYYSQALSIMKSYI